jgi:hypothetical protein
VEGLNAATLDIIGLAGFGYAFEALGRPTDAPNELHAAFAAMVGTGDSSIDYALLGALPGAQFLPTSSQRGRLRARAIMDRIGRELLRERKAIAMYVRNSASLHSLNFLRQGIGQGGRGRSRSALASCPCEHV